MLDASQYFIGKTPVVKQKKPQFSFTYLAKKILERQKHDKDTIIVVVGERRNGKSNWGLKLTKEFISQKRLENPEFKWSWKANFPLTRSDAMAKVEDVPRGSFIFYDEGGDFMYRGDTLSYMNKMLIKFMSKTGTKRLLTLIILPDIYILDPKILNMAHFLVAVPYRYENICSFSFIYSRNPNPFVQDKFGLEQIKRRFAGTKIKRSLRMATMSGKISIIKDKKKMLIPYPKELFSFLKGLPTYIHSHRFSAVEKSFEERYIKNVKEKQLAIKDEVAFVKQSDFNKLYNKYTTLIFNLYTKRQMRYTWIEQLHMNSMGVRLSTASSIRKLIQSVAERNNQSDVLKIREEADGKRGNRILEGQDIRKEVH